MKFITIARNNKLWLKTDSQNRYILLANRVSGHTGRLFYTANTPTPGVAFLVDDPAICPVICLDDESHNDWNAYRVEAIQEVTPQK